jgi:hypothetical protein
MVEVRSSTGNLRSRVRADPTAAGQIRFRKAADGDRH